MDFALFSKWGKLKEPIHKVDNPLPAAGLELARDVDQAALLRMLVEHIHQACLEGDDPDATRLLHPLDGLLVDTALVRCDEEFPEEDIV